jgi:GNAT superfamily N-acetyltransferase
MISDREEFDIDYTKLDEEVLLKKWLMWPGVLEWYPMAQEPDVDLVAKNWIGFARYKSSLTAYYKGKPVGIATLLLMPYRKVAHHGMMYIIVDPKWQGQGVGTALIRNLMHLAKTRFKLEDIHFDIYEGCRIMSILKKLGFEELLRQEKWVKTKQGYLARHLMEVKL